MHALQEMVYVNSGVLQQEIAAAKSLARQQDNAEHAYSQNSKVVFELYDLECQLSAEESRLKEQLDNMLEMRRNRLAQIQSKKAAVAALKNEVAAGAAQ